MNSPLRKEGTVCFLLKKEAIFMIQQQYPNGTIVWSGVGGMIDEGEAAEDAVIREGKEEMDILIEKTSLKYVGIVQETENFTLHVYIADHWEGEPTISEETIKNFRWFKLSEIPYDHMWPDNRYWVPKIFEGKFVKARVVKDIYKIAAIAREDVLIEETA